LLEAGHAELAAHFQERDHPKGCWALDLILGKRRIQTREFTAPAKGPSALDGRPGSS
jgi:hypothetical protein